MVGSIRNTPAETSAARVPEASGTVAPKFTPGPLTVHHRPHFGTFSVIDHKNDIATANCYYEPDFPELRARAKANATLYAAAPDLYSALKEVLNAYVPGWDQPEYSDIGGSVMHARAALRSAQKEG